MLSLLWLTTSAAPIQEVVKGYKLLFIHILVLLEQSRHQGEMSQASTTQFQNLFKYHPRKTDVGNWLHVCVHHLLSASVTCAWGVWKLKCENRELSKETTTKQKAKQKITFFCCCFEKLKDRYVYSPLPPTWK